MLSLYFLHYNFCRQHKTTRVTPAMEAGITRTSRDAAWIVGLIDARTRKPRRPKTYRKRRTGLAQKDCCPGAGPRSASRDATVAEAAGLLGQEPARVQLGGVKAPLPPLPACPYQRAVSPNPMPCSAALSSAFSRRVASSFSARDVGPLCASLSRPPTL